MTRLHCRRILEKCRNCYFRLVKEHLKRNNNNRHFTVQICNAHSTAYAMAIRLKRTPF
jgi:preprotein translocase subunit SecA